MIEEREGEQLHNSTNKTGNILVDATKRKPSFHCIRQQYFSCDKKEVLNIMAEADMESLIPSMTSLSITKNTVPKMSIESPILDNGCE